MRWHRVHTALELILLVFALGMVASKSHASDALELAAYIDAQLAQHHAAVGVPASPLADDSEFLRRVYLDLTGTIPTSGQVRQFLADTRADKRQIVIDELLDSPAYVENFKSMWLKLLIPEINGDQQLEFVSREFGAWLRRQLSENRPYNEWVGDILRVPLAGRGDGPYRFISGRVEPLPTAFYAAKDVRPENLAAATARVFLGLRVDCAQCHDHPFADWQQEQFWAYAAFFQGLDRQSNNPFGSLVDLFGSGARGPVSIAIPEKSTTVQAAFLDGTQPEVNRQRPRDLVAQWIASAENSYFPRAAVNRLWAHLFGLGLVEPVDDLDNPSDDRHAQLLDGIAQRFVEANFDVKFLLRGITNSQAYQRSRQLTHPLQRDPMNFARKTPRKLQPEQMLTSIRQAMGVVNVDDFADEMQFAYNNDHIQFLQLFEETTERPIEKSTAVLEALVLMNGSLIARATHDSESPLISALAEMPGLTTDEAVKTLFFATVSRPPTDKELALMLQRFEQRPTGDTSRHVMSDIFWALLNSSDFATN